MIKAILFDGSEIELKYSVTELSDRTVVTLSKELDTSNIKQIDFDYLGTVANEGDEGYILLPNEGMICRFSEREDMEYASDRYVAPVFGVKTAEKTLLAIVTGMAYDYLMVVGVKDGKYYTYPRFMLDGDNLYEDISISYYPLEGDDANYSGMARRYRQYQLDRGECIPIKERAKTSPELSYARDSVMIRIRLGWKPVPSPVMHQTPENEPEMIVATDFKRVEDIIDELKKQGVDKAELCLVGWNTKGHDGRWPQCFPVEPQLGGEEGLRKLIKKAQDNGYQIVCHSNSTDTYEVSEMWDKEEVLVNKNGELSVDANAWSAGMMYQICPKIALRQAKEILPKIADLGFRGIHYIDVLNIVMPRKCYHKDHPLNIGQSIAINRDIMKLAKEQFGGYSSEGGYDFGAKYQDFALNMEHGEKISNPLCDEEVPFWQIVYHGIILSNPNMHTTLNYSIRKDKNAELKLVEYGGRPTYYYNSIFTKNWRDQADKDLLCGTKEQLEYGVSCIKKGYDLHKSLAYLQNEFIEEHKKLENGVYRIRYSDNTVITVDYNKSEYQVTKEN